MGVTGTDASLSNHRATLPVRVIASIEGQPVIDKILKHLQAKEVLPRPPELPPATRASPDSDLFA